MDEKEKNGGELTPQRGNRRAREAKVKLDVIDLYLKGLSGPMILTRMKESGITVGIKKISAVINKEISIWVKQKSDLIDNLKAQELAKVNRLEFEYWEAWQRSCKESISKTTERTAAEKKAADKKNGMPTESVEVAGKKLKFDISKISELKRSNAGDPRFLDGIQWCVEMRCKLLGLEAAQYVPPKDPEKGATIYNIQRVVFTTQQKALEA